MQCFTSIVGPNGSGKSNVIDALLFVFGKRAKQIRLNKVSELIHNSSSYQNLEYARVSVYFQNVIDDEVSWTIRDPTLTFLTEESESVETLTKCMSS